jgi:hypothetical protein
MDIDEAVEVEDDEERDGGGGGILKPSLSIAAA